MPRAPHRNRPAHAVARCDSRNRIELHLPQQVPGTSAEEMSSMDDAAGHQHRGGPDRIPQGRRPIRWLRPSPTGLAPASTRLS
jgi:hypothetical protein